ncbi:MAG: hypothetical protein ACTSRI_22130 [Promethearchaeota archaeon]
MRKSISGLPKACNDIKKYSDVNLIVRAQIIAFAMNPGNKHQNH